jgi:hypothetical protein
MCTPWPLVRMRTIPTERPKEMCTQWPLVGKRTIPTERPKEMCMKEKKICRRSRWWPDTKIDWPTDRRS